ncbi:putative spermidine/putrescine transport system permease protein [Geodermatophilus bullaregiensis]|uniref:ABC transporter permease subunit n=1 Tax=Geodermatophilus bullaregiensis TaxID=1564160 RepID=UPI0027DD5828|nr:ABC transporter permease subunit [Geodermatophilus bullaregiensis]MBM7808845.1 putative spermidine/putrescine transport system permease protein [Geodermatophilus bullaregiensis]
MPAPVPAPRSRALLLLLPAVVPTAAVLGAALTVAVLQSTGLLPVVGEPEPSLAAYRELAGGRALLDGLRVSLGIAAASTALALAVGLGTALLARTTRLGGRLLRAAAAATVPVPHLVGAAAVGLLLADSGLAARTLSVTPGQFPPLVAGPWWAAVVAEYAWKESAFVALVVLAALAAGERELDETAATLGAGPWQRLRRVALPLAAPAAIGAGGVGFAYVLGSYDVAWLLGRSSPEPLPVLAHRLFTDVDLARREQALAVAVVTTVLALAGLVLTAALLARTARRAAA